MNQKVAAAGFAGAITTILVFIAGQFGLEITAEVGAALSTLLATVAGYLKPEKPTQ